MTSKILAAALAALTIATASVATTSQAEAGNGGAVIAGFVGGAILGGVIAQASQPHYAPRYVYEEPRYVVVRRAPSCHKVLVEDRWGNEYWRKVCH